MAYYNNRNSGYSRGGYSGGYNRGYNRNNYNNNAQQKKRSACKKGYANGDADAPYYAGYNKSRSGFLSILARPYKKTKDSTSKSGKRFQNWFVTYKVGRFGAEQKTSGMLNLDSGKLVVESLGIVMNPKTNYCGTYKRR